MWAGSCHPWRRAMATARCSGGGDGGREEGRKGAGGPGISGADAALRCGAARDPEPAAEESENPSAPGTAAAALGWCQARGGGGGTGGTEEGRRRTGQRAGRGPRGRGQDVKWCGDGFGFLLYYSSQENLHPFNHFHFYRKHLFIYFAQQ